MKGLKSEISESRFVLTSFVAALLLALRFAAPAPAREKNETASS
jgi:hypothetical protein